MIQLGPTSNRFLLLSHSLESIVNFITVDFVKFLALHAFVNNGLCCTIILLVGHNTM